MFLPFGDEPNAPQTPYITYTLIALNVMVWVFFCAPMASEPASLSDPQWGHYLHAMGLDKWHNSMVPGISAYDLWLHAHAFRPAHASIMALFLSLFLHAGWLHLLGNMLFLYIFGDNVEAHLGKLGYVLIYLVCGAFGTLCYSAFQMQSQLPIIGASGAISGILGCYFVWFPHNRVRVLMFFLLFIDVIMVPARVVLAFYLVIENIWPLLTQSAHASGVAYGAHLGGFVAGATFADVWRRRQMAKGHGAYHLKGVWARFRREGPDTPGATNAFVPPALPDAAPIDALEQKVVEARWQEAAAIEAGMLRVERIRQAPDTLLTLADGLTQERAYDAAMAVLQRFISLFDDTRHAGDVARAQLRAGLIAWHGYKQSGLARAHLLASLALAADTRVHTAARLALRDIDAAPGPSDRQ